MSLNIFQTLLRVGSMKEVLLDLGIIRKDREFGSLKMGFWKYLKVSGLAFA